MQYERLVKLLSKDTQKDLIDLVHWERKGECWDSIASIRTISNAQAQGQTIGRYEASIRAIRVLRELEETLQEKEREAKQNFCSALLNSEAPKTEDSKNPSYYKGKIEAFDFLKDKLTEEELAGFCKGNVIKYVTREKKKNGLEDLEKAQWYLEALIQQKKNGK